MDLNRAVEIEEDRLSEMYENGELSGEEYSCELNNLYREARAALEEEAQQAYDEVMNRY